MVAVDSVSLAPGEGALVPVLRHRNSRATDAEGFEIVQPLAERASSPGGLQLDERVEPAPGIWDAAAEEGHVLVSNMGILDITLELGDPVA